MALEGKELSGEVGDYGTYHVDISDKGLLEISLGVKVDLIEEIEKLAKKTSTPIDDAAISWIKKLLGK